METTNFQRVVQEMEANPYLYDSPQLNDTREGSKFESGTLMADGPSKRFEAHGHEILCKEIVYSRKAEADESKLLNQWHMLISKFGSSVRSQTALFKTAEVRKVELESILEMRI